MSPRFRLALMRCSFFLAMFAATSLRAQDLEWSRTYGGAGDDGALSVRMTSGGGMVMSGFASPAAYASTDLSLIKTDASGNAVWRRSFGGAMNDYGACVRELPGGGYVIGGRYEESPERFDAYLVRTDAAGNALWQRRYDLSDDERAHAVCLAVDGGFLLAGQAWVPSGPFGSYDVWLVKTDADGNLQWQRTYAAYSEGADVALSVEPAADGGYIVGGFTQGGAWDAYLIRIDALGNPIWQRTYGVGSSDECYSVQPLEDGTFVFAGIAAPHGDGDVFLGQVASNGDLLWMRTYGGGSDDFGQAVCRTPDGGFAVTGMTASYGAGQWDVWLLRTDATGNLLWSLTFGGAGDDRGLSVVTSADGGIVIAGWAWSFGSGMGDANLIKVHDAVTTGVATDASPLENGSTVALRAWPNPCHGSLTIELELVHPEGGRVAIFDAAGRRVRTLAAGALASGRHAFSWDRRDDDGREVPSGLYFARAELGGREETRRLVVLR